MASYPEIVPRAAASVLIEPDKQISHIRRDFGDKVASFRSDMGEQRAHGMFPWAAQETQTLLHISATRTASK